MGCHASTGGDSSGDNGVFRFRDPVAGAEQIGHVVPIVQDSQASLGISMESATFCQPFHNSSNGWMIQSDHLLLFEGSSNIIPSRSFVRPILPKPSWTGAVRTEEFPLRLSIATFRNPSCAIDSHFFGLTIMLWSHWLGYWLFDIRLPLQTYPPFLCSLAVLHYIDVMWYLICHRCFLLLDQMRLLSPVSRTQWLLRRFCFLLCTIDDSLVSDALFLGGLICFRICFIVLTFLLLFTNGNCPFRVVVADWRANRPGHVP